MKVMRTPDERFENLEGYAFALHYGEVEDEDGTRLRIHRVRTDIEARRDVRLPV